jgi:hypothetical protein
MNGKLDMIEKQQAESEARNDEALSRIDRKIDKILEVTSASAARLDQHERTLVQHDKRIMESERERATLRNEVDVFKEHIKSDQPVDSWFNGKVVAVVVAACGVVGAALLNHYVSQVVAPREQKIVYTAPQYPEMDGVGRPK